MPEQDARAMSADPIPIMMARYLAKLWDLQKTSDLRKHFVSIYGFEPEVLPVFDKLLIAEIENGDAGKGIIGSIVLRWWEMNDSGLKDSTVETLPLIVDGLFYKTPILKFHIEQDLVAFGEKLGPKISSRHVGRLVPSGGYLGIAELKMVWAYRE